MEEQDPSMDTFKKFHSPEEIFGHVSSTLDRLSVLYEVNQRFKDEEYVSEDYKYSAKFEVGDNVICGTQFYYRANIMAVYDGYVCTELKKRIPCYRLKYEGWKQYDADELQWVLEYDVIGSHKFDKPNEILLAHYWNRCIRGVVAVSPNPNVMVGLVNLSESEEAVYSKRWEDEFQDKFTTKMTFKQLMGIP